MHREQIDAALAAQLVAEQFPHWAHLPVSPVAFSGYGRIKLGGPDDKPEFSNFAWFAMLFQAGMGIGLVFWGVAEPVWHYGDPPLGLAAPRTPQAADLAMQTAFFHWTLHPWTMYATIGIKPFPTWL